MRLNQSWADTDQPVSPYIDGKLLGSKSDDSLRIVNPSNGQHLFSMPAGCEADVDAAVAAARRSFDDGSWSDAPPSSRKTALLRLADLVAADAKWLNGLDAGEMGKPVGLSLFDASAAARLTRFYAESVDKVVGDVYSTDSKSFVTQRWSPRGVIGAIVPWNFPTYTALLKVAPALAAGNTLVLKPSELSSRSAVRLAQLAVEAGIPPGVFNVVPGSGRTVGRPLGLHADVNMITFTGSTSVGKAMLQYSASSNLKTVLAECGGKSPQIVFNDGVDLDAAADAVSHFLLANQGQICSVGSRLLVQREIQGVMIEKISERFKSIVMGGALSPETTFGPLASAAQCDRVMRYIGSARAEGARLVAGGRKALPGTGGYFVEPTLFSDVSPSSKIAQEEIFGPVLSVTPFDDEAEAIRIANGTIYGLAAYVWTANLSRGMRMSKIRSSVWVSAASPSGEGAGHALAFEPYGQSGIGVEGGLAGMQSYLRRHVLSVSYA